MFKVVVHLRAIVICAQRKREGGVGGLKNEKKKRIQRAGGGMAECLNPSYERERARARH